MSISSDYTLQMMEQSQWQNQTQRLENLGATNNCISGAQLSSQITDQVNSVLNDQLSQAK